MKSDVSKNSQKLKKKTHWMCTSQIKRLNCVNVWIQSTEKNIVMTNVVVVRFL